MFQELLANVNSRAREFDQNLTRIKTLNDQLVSRSEKLLSELNGLIEKVHTKEKKKCQICLTRPMAVAFVACGHCVCEACATRCRNGRARCFTCRQPVLDIIKLYF